MAVKDRHSNRKGRMMIRSNRKNIRRILGELVEIQTSESSIRKEMGGCFDDDMDKADRELSVAVLALSECDWHMPKD